MTERTKHWKSLAEKRGDPAFLKTRENEFSQELPVDGLLSEVAGALSFTRRDFLKLMGFSAAAVSTACSRMPVKKAIPYLNKPEEIIPGKSLWYASSCVGCAAACATLVKTRDGRPIKVEGNPESPLNKGGLCAAGQAQVLSLYDSGRLQAPLVAGKAATWEDVDAKIAAGLAHVKTSGRGVRVLTGSLVSPSARAAVDVFLKSFGDGKRVAYDPVSYAGILDAHQKSFGKRVLPHYRFDKARVVVGIAADFLGTWLSPVEFAKGYAASRRVKNGKMSRHVHFESVMTLTGANADKRVPVNAWEESLVAVHLLDAVRSALGGSRLDKLPELPEAVLSAVGSVAKELVAARGHSIVVSGLNDEDVQTVIAAINADLGNYGATLDLDKPSLQREGDDAAFDALISEMERGDVGALFVWGVNPAYDWHDAKRFAAALAKVPLVVSLSRYADETAALAGVVAPDTHALESWGDFEPVAGTLHLMQPVIRSVYDVRQALEGFLKWSGDARHYLDFLKDSWRDGAFTMQAFEPYFETFWNARVRDGYCVVPGVASTTVSFAGDADAAALRTIDKIKASSEGGVLVVRLIEPVTLRDGTSANNPWLQEVPDPVAKITWGNFASLSPAFAKAQNISDGDVVALMTDAGAIQIPAFVQPGMGRDTIGVFLGYGRAAAGKVGNGVGVNAYSLATFSQGSRGYAVKATLKKTGAHENLASTQEHHSLEGRDIVQTLSLAGLAAGKKAKDMAKPGAEMLWTQHEKVGHAWGMAIDLNACIGCSGCLVGCQAENNVPVVGKDEVHRRREMHWIRIDRYYEGDEENPETLFEPMMCQHCANAPCESVCPVAATVHSSDGLNQQVYNRCVGTRYCANNCPYKVRRFNWFDYADNKNFDYNMDDELGKLVLNPDIVVRSRGVMEKCSLCVQRIQEGKLAAKLAGRDVADNDIKTACQQSCPSDAILFGDLANPESGISKSLTDNPRKYHVLGELNVQPAVTYLAKVRNDKGA